MKSVAEMLLEGRIPYGWSLDGFEVVRRANEPDSAQVTLEGEADEFTRHAALLDVGHKFDKQGFTVSYYNLGGVMPERSDDPCPESRKQLVNYLHVSIIRAENKLGWAAFGPNGGNVSPNFPGLLAAGPLMREEGTQPRRVVLWENSTANKPYITHVQCIPDGKGDLCSPYLDGGHYFYGRGKAVSDFADRVRWLHQHVFPDEWKEV